MNNLSELVKAIGSNWQHFVGLLVLIVLAFVLTYAVEKRAASKEGKTKILDTRKMAICGIFGAIAFVIMLFEFPLLFIAPGFYKLDFSDVPALIVGFACGPFAGIIVEFIKVLLNLLLQGTTSGFVGEIANFVVGSVFVGTASAIYRFKKTRKNALISCIIATIAIAFAGALLNAYFMIPAYAAMFGGINNIIAAGTEIFSFIDTVFEFCLVCVAPFNVIKGVAASSITFVLYKALSPILKAEPMAAPKKKEVKAS
ncbi:ECF transporter S component [Butyrivibrio proteoclasticus]|uniref:ECF transporter S component n=1 Tax=Butyrivibrio proteoclasticus TaxID=43305 RepID=UPI0006864D91|nr:ECF transporter S component [Butyrivibrio proteoclasticus]